MNVRAGRAVRLFASPPHACSYLPGRQAVTTFVDPLLPKSSDLYAALLRLGFRRSGEQIYAPNCPGCEACVPVRIPVAQFRPRRSQRRIEKRNLDLRVTVRRPAFRSEEFALYREYLAARHSGGGMDDPAPEQYLEFLSSSWSDTVFFAFSLGPRTVAVAVADCLGDSMSAVYTFFSPHLPERALGVNAILFEIEEARRRGLRWLYLGYWLSECAKMRYKADYHPQERLLEGAWQPSP